MEEIRIESEGVTVLIKEDQNKEDHVSFRLREEDTILPFYVNVSKRNKNQVFIYIQFPQEEISKILKMSCGDLIEQIDYLVLEVLDLVALHKS